MEEKMGAGKYGRRSAFASGIASASSSSTKLSLPGSFTKPSWLLLSIADLDKRMKMVSSKAIKEERADSFAEQAEAYYQRRPWLLSLLQDLYNAYLILADRHCRTLAKQHSAAASIPAFHLNSDEEICSSEADNESDAESSLSYQPPVSALVMTQVQVMTDAEQIVVELVIRNVEYEITTDELNGEEKKCSESWRKIELQKSLLEVLESERLILLNENARLEYKVGTLLEENKGLGTESLFMKRKAGELARCILKLREDHRVDMLSRKIEDLQAQIYGLEKRNKEYYNKLVIQEEEKNKIMKMKHSGNVLMKRRWRHGGSDGGSGSGRRRVFKLWEKVKNFDMLLCGTHYKSAACC